MKKFFGGLVLAGFTALFVWCNSLIAGCSSNSTGPVTVTQQPTPCGGTFGFAYNNGANSSFAGHILAEAVTITAAGPVTANNLGIIFTGFGTTGEQFEGAIYGGNGTAPTTLLVQSSPATMLLNQWIEVPLPPTVLYPNNVYWLAFMAQASASCGGDTLSSSGDSFGTTATVTYGAFPSTMPAGTTGTYPLCFYVTTCP